MGSSEHRLQRPLLKATATELAHLPEPYCPNPQKRFAKILVRRSRDCPHDIVSFWKDSQTGPVSYPTPMNVSSTSDVSHRILRHLPSHLFKDPLCNLLRIGTRFKLHTYLEDVQMTTIKLQKIALFLDRVRNPIHIV